MVKGSDILFWGGMALLVCCGIYLIWNATLDVAHCEERCQQEGYEYIRSGARMCYCLDEQAQEEKLLANKRERGWLGW